MKKLILSAFIAMTAGHLMSQQTVFEESETVYSKEIAGGISLHTNGWGINFYMAKYLSGFTKRQMHLELVSMTDPRQYKIIVDNGGYFYGKLNSLTLFRTSIGFQKEFIPRQSVKGVSISYILNAGISNGFTKPIYLQIQLENGSIVDERYEPAKHNRNNIAGRSSPFIGLDELSYYPGLFLRSALNFDYGGKSNSVRAIEVGLAADLFPKAIPMMAFQDPHSYFLTAFVNFEFGGRKFPGETKNTSPEEE